MRKGKMNHLGIGFRWRAQDSPPSFLPSQCHRSRISHQAVKNLMEKKRGLLLPHRRANVALIAAGFQGTILCRLSRNPWEEIIHARR
jgi:hypothetical protein